MALTQEEASKQIAEKIDMARKLLSESEDLADEAGLEFGWNPFYGGGGYYVGRNSEDWTESYADGEDTGYWRSSSQNC